ncbi:MAG: hypothetical protein ACE5I3_02390 [Phycisphaerae bacterium]
MQVTAPVPQPALSTLVGVALVPSTLTGCAQLHYQNAVPFIEQGIRASQDNVEIVMFKASILVPARDILTLDPLWRALFGSEAWNLDGADVPDSSFYTNRPPEELTPQRVARGACTTSAPQSPYQIRKIKVGGGSSGFVGTDALGRTFLFKLDHPDYPELGSTAAIVGSRMLWALGYNVPPVFLVTIAGTGDARFDGRRATAALFLDDVIGHFHFDWFRHRRELRGLRLASAWINDTDRIGSNTLVVVRGGRATYYLIDFNSCLGSWQGRPKEPWRGYRHAWEALPLAPDPPAPVISPAVGRLAADFDPLRWRPQAPNNAFNHMTEADAAWIIARIARLERPHLEAIVAEARLSSPDDAKLLVDTLLQRREAILSLAR